MSHRYAISSSRIILPDGTFAGHLIINGNKFEAVVPAGQLPSDIINEDVGDLVVMPGVIDPHVHINEPGRARWEGFETATKAAVAGGTTTLVDMPLNCSPVTTNLDAFQQKLSASQDKLYVNCGFWGGYVPGSKAGLEELLAGGVLGIKVFMTDSGLDEFQAVDKKDLKEALSLMSGSDLPLLAHAEIQAPLPYPDPFKDNKSSYQAHLRSRPDNWELQAIRTLIDFCEQTGSPVHIVHLASKTALPELQVARKRLPITVETCPHYLYFSAEEIPDGRTEFKCAPPIRGRSNNLQLWQALTEGVIDFVATDHSPAPLEMKYLDSGNLQKAWGGISSLQFLLPVVWTCCQRNEQTVNFLSKILCENASRFIGMPKKGKILPGFDADLVIWDPGESFTVTRDMIRYKHKISPYIGEKLNGVVYRTYVNGHLVFDNGNIDPLPRGEVLQKT